MGSEMCIRDSIRVVGIESQKYLDIRRKYRRRCRRAKRGNCREYVNETPGQHEMSKLSQMIQHRDRHTLHVLETQSGSTTEPGTETIKQLIHTHFPNASFTLPNTTYSSADRILSKDLLLLYDYARYTEISSRLLIAISTE